MDDLSTLTVIKAIVKLYSKKRRIDSSFGLALANYATHKGVRDLDQLDLPLVLERIAEQSARLDPDNLDGSSVTKALQYSFGCNEGMGECHRAAETILNRRLAVSMAPPDTITQLPAVQKCVLEIDPSFYLALENYTHHLGVRDLDEWEKLSVMDTLAEESILRSKNIVNGRAVTDALSMRFGCNKGMGGCHKAAETILDRDLKVDFDEITQNLITD